LTEFSMHFEWLDKFAWHVAGRGFLEFRHGQQVGVDWQLVQTSAGRLFVLAKGNGTTELGHDALQMLLHFESPSQLLSKDEEWATRIQMLSLSSAAHPDAEANGWISISAHSAERSRKGAAATAHRFAISNLAPDRPPTEEWAQNGYKLIWRPVDEYARVISTLRTLHRIAVTATLTIEIGDHVEAARVADVACDLASYACGCRIQWAYQEGLDVNGLPVTGFISNAITGPYVGLPLIKEDALWEFMQQQWNSYAAFRAENLSQARRLLGLLLNATADDDFMELRGSKLATTIDAVVTMVIGTNPEAVPFLSARTRKAFGKALREFIRTDLPSRLREDLSPEIVDAVVSEMTDKSNELLRLSFRNAIRRTCNAIQIELEEADISRFVRARNELIHEGRYVCQSPAPPGDWPFAKTAEEYFWMLRFVDRVVLRTIKYRGAFLDRCTRDGSEVPAESG